jgi:hypothetical protein
LNIIEIIKADIIENISNNPLNDKVLNNEISREIESIQVDYKKLLNNYAKGYL